jgi:hypothetical protein
MQITIAKFTLSVLTLTSSICVYPHAGGLGRYGCHTKKNIGRHCHGENAGKYIPEEEPKRIKKLHDATCNQQSPEGYFPKKDLYGKGCNRRKSITKQKLIDFFAGAGGMDKRTGNQVVE